MTPAPGIPHVTPAPGSPQSPTSPLTLCTLHLDVAAAALQQGQQLANQSVQVGCNGVLIRRLCRAESGGHIPGSGDGMGAERREQRALRQHMMWAGQPGLHNPDT